MSVDLIRHRLHNQLLSQTECIQPSDVVAWFGAVQAQDYAGAKWALAQRLRDSTTDAALEQAFNEGKILRTHVMRPTWHFVTPADIRWMLELTASRVRIAIGFLDRPLQLEQAIFKKNNVVLRKALRDHQQLTRAELAPILQKSGVPVDGLRLGHLLMHAELDGVICSGARKGRQFTYALLEERAPQAKTLEWEEALRELTRRYFRSHGPAALQDFVWWSGLTVTDARRGIEAAGSELDHEVVEGQSYWFPSSTPVKNPLSRAHLLPNYDEYTVGYKDRSAIFDESHTDQLDSRESILAQSILIGGRVSGLWKRTIKKSEVLVEVAPFTALRKAQTEAVIRAVHQYGEFLGLPTRVLN